TLCEDQLAKGNNKHTLGKRKTNTIINYGCVSFENNGNTINNDANSQHHSDTGGAHLQISTNGSSSSS
ncbi:unnamed protein product, partial [Ilex paraguariensis]